jgi:HD-like signal output (HDOD) protein
VKRVLFVDDDSSILDALRLRLRGARSRWEMAFVEGGSQAIVAMETQPFDVVVTDMRMPAMNGAELLMLIGERWPQTIRIVLSGYSEEDQATRLLTLTHRYLAKPADAGMIEEAVDRCIHLHELLDHPGLRRIVGRIRRLPAVPKTYARLRSVMAEAEVAVTKISAIIHQDPAIAAKVLQVVNSAFFRRSRRISRIDQAVAHLGLNAIRSLVLTAEVFSMWCNDAAPPGFEPERLQEAAQRVATAAVALSLGTPVADDALLAGLFHNIGYWVLLQECSDDVRRATEIACEQDVPLYEAEKNVMGTSHAEVGAYLLGLWGLPHAIVEAIALQHRPRAVLQTSFDVLAVLVVAKCLAGQPSAAIYGDDYLQSVNAPFDWAEARCRVQEAIGRPA